ncbi:Crp/Fnr family transcriptional regulator [Desertivirga xinjiangensis]|uniref:Crp/Fnr family transcriptional regulator n=1 Tax=Desertivirga xinjiangensis TaxID=539206 RepID=UPI00210EE944|nr:cyclic nucleotide-binding domain-containing protein [Pedobacter xinjiangensis]
MFQIFWLLPCNDRRTAFLKYYSGSNFNNQILFRAMSPKSIPNILAGIRKYYPVPEASMAQLVSYLEHGDYLRGDLLIRKGVRNRYVYFIENGCTRTYIIAKGKDITNWFSCEGDITFSSSSLYHDAPPFEYVEVLEKSTIFTISIENLEKLLLSDIHLTNWSRTIHQEVLLKMQTLRLDRLSLSAKERYDKFCRENPVLLNRVNLGHIASYLGISQQYLSNLRGDHRF